jgi:hypothetical protein
MWPANAMHGFGVGANIDTMSDADWDQLAAAGGRTIRTFVHMRREGGRWVPVNPGAGRDWVTDLKYRVWEGSKRGMYTVVAFGVMQDTQSLVANNSSTSLTGAQQTYIRDIVEVVRQFSGETAVCGYDVLNEPIAPPGQSRKPWTLFTQETVNSIRAIGCRQPVIIQSLEGGGIGGFTYLDPVHDALNNVIYSAHSYSEFGYTHQNVLPQFAGPHRLYTYNQAKFEADLKPVADFKKKHNARIYIGEIGCTVYAPGREQWFTDHIAACKKLGFDVSIHQINDPCWCPNKGAHQAFGAITAAMKSAA